MNIDTNGNWKLYWGAAPLPTGARAVGTVDRGNGDHGALLLMASGQYAQGNAGSLRTINQGAVKVALGISSHGGPRGGGRPATGAKPNRTFRLSDDEYTAVKKFLKELRGKKDEGQRKNIEK